MRFFTSGMWGIGNYFALNAQYCNLELFHKTQTGERQLLFVNVLIGEHIELNPDSSLRMPPLKDGEGSERYDSVKGVAPGSEIFMTYENGRAYPEYLVTYKC